MQKNITFPREFIITGTDTNMGKTVVSAILMTGLKGKYWKPIHTGIEDDTDTQQMMNYTQLNQKHFFPERYHFACRMSPHHAAAIEGTHINLNDFRIPNYQPFEHLIVETAGGVMVPLNDHQYNVDLIKKLNIPVIVVCRSSLGTLNHTLLTLHLLRSYSIPVFGVIVNGPRNPFNAESIAKYGRVPVLAQIEPIELNHEAMKRTFDQHFGHTAMAAASK